MADAYDFWAERVPQEQVAAIDDFWIAFEEIAPRLERHFRGRAPSVDPQAELRRALGGLRERLVCDIEFGPEGTLVLVVTPELHHSRRALARAAITRAPDLPGWSVADARRPVAAIPDAMRAILARSRSEAFAVEEIEPRRGAHRLVDLVARGHGERDFIADQAGVIFSVLLGERADQDWLGETRGRRHPVRSLREALFGRQSPVNDRWMSEFREAALAIVERFEADRPERPFAETPMSVEETRSFRLRPRDGDAERRLDATLWQSRYPALAAARLAGSRVGALRFSRFGEVFCGLKIRRTRARPFEDLGEIATLAARLEEALMPAGLGGVIGRGSGIDHVYVDLALLNLRGGIEALRRALAEQGEAGPAWLLFDDAGLEDLYHPMTPKSPPTPMA
jgi:hypothetical protein